MTKARMMSGARVGVLCGAMSALVTGCTSAADQIDKLCPTMEAARPACEAQAPEMRMSCYVRALHEVASHDEVRAALVGAGDTPPAERYAALQRAFGALGRPDWQCAPLEELLRPDAQAVLSRAAEQARKALAKGLGAAQQALSGEAAE